MLNTTSIEHALYAVCPIDGRYVYQYIYTIILLFIYLFIIHSPTFRYHKQTEKQREECSEYGLLRRRVQVEIEWQIELSEYEGINELPKQTNNEKEKLLKIYKEFTIKDAQEIKKIEEKTRHDQKSVEYFLQDYIKKQQPEKYIKQCSFIHFSCTSEDINNLSYSQMIQSTLNTIQLPIIKNFQLLQIDNIEKYSNIPMMSQTHGQPATPTTVGKELANFAIRLNEQYIQLKNIKLKGKCNGAVGNYNSHIIAYKNIPWEKISKNLIENKFNLEWSQFTTQIEFHDRLSEVQHICMRICNILLDFDKDMWGYISRGCFLLHVEDNEVGSSTMPHKVNPIDFENSEGNLGLANSIFQHLSSKLVISRFQRDLSDSTTLRNLGIGFGYMIISFESSYRGQSKIIPNEAYLLQELNNNWELLGEPVQTVMRKYGVYDSYERLKVC